tara:strand:+ start:10377 stop:14747 length:4371 start_codon:yes stop_codon:yes gene_type:complete
MSSLFPQLTPGGIRFFVKKIANSKKEVQVSLIDNSVESYQSGNFNLFNPFTGNQGGQTPIFNIFTAIKNISTSIINDSEFDLVVDVGKGKYIPVLNLLFEVDVTKDQNDVSAYHMVYKLNEALPSEIKKLDTINFLIIKSELLNQEVFYAGKRPPVIKKFGLPLETDFSVTIPYQTEVKNQDFENFNQLSGSVGKRQTTTILSSSYQERLVNYNTFDNFVFFGSAKKRLENFKTKLETIESIQTQISKSLYSQGQTTPDTSDFSPDAQTSVTNIRKQYFKEMYSIINGFTDYEKFLYYDHQNNNSSSATPSLGKNYVDYEPLVASNEVKKQTDYEGFPSVYFISASSEKDIPLTAGKYKVENNFNNSSGSFYLSFLMRASSSFENRFKIKNNQVASKIRYPEDSLKTEIILQPNATGSEYVKYVFKSSASFWVPEDTYGISLPNSNPITNWDSGTDQVKIIQSGKSITGSRIEAFGDYSELVTTTPVNGVVVTGSFVPKGDLFNISLQPTSSATSAIITDIKITETNPINFLPFSNLYSVSSSNFTSWYNGLIDSASEFDTQNINRLYNNIPSLLQTEDESSNQDMITYVDMMGEFFDEYKVLVDDFYRVFDLGFSDYDMVPPKFNSLLANSLGYNFLSETSGSLLEKFGLFESFSSEQKEYNNKLFNNILNNIHYIYKSKGTDNSIRALLNCYGLPSNVLKIKESGQNLKHYDQTFLSNDTDITALGKLSEMSSSVTYEQQTDKIHTLIVHPQMDLKTDWNSSTSISASCIEGMFKMSPTENTMSLFESKTSAILNQHAHWRLTAIPENSSNTKRAKIKFQLNTSDKGSDTLTSNNVFTETPFLNILDNDFTHILLQRSASVGTGPSETIKYEIQVGKKSGDEITFITSSNVLVNGATLAGGRANRNWLTGSSNQFHITPNYSGSVGEIRAWKTPLSIGAFKQHIYNPKSIVGNHFSSSIEELIYHLPMQENYKSGSDSFKIIDTAVNPDFDASIDVDDNLFNSQSFWYDYSVIETFNFPVYGNGGGTLQYNDNTILIPDTFKLRGDLSYQESVIQQNHDVLSYDVINTPQLDFSRSPQEVINDFIKDNLGNLDFNDLFADPRDEYKDSYPDLDKFNNDLIFKYNISVQINKFKRAVSRIFNSSLVESTKRLMPARAQLIDGIVLKPTYTQRIKAPVLRERPSVEKVNDNAGSLQDTTTFIPGEEFLPKETTFNNLEADFEQTAYPWHVNKGDNVTNVRNSFEKNFSERPELSWGEGVNDTHFVGSDLGDNDDFNTGYYELQDVFQMIGDTEFLSGSLRNGLAIFDYDKESTFFNKQIVKTAEVIQERELGTTLQFVSTDSSSFGKLIDTNLRRPQNHITTFGGHSHMNLGRIYEGYQHRGSTDKKIYTDGNGPTIDGLFNDTLAHAALQNLTDDSSALTYEDLTTRAFYSIKIDNKGKGKLKVIRTDDVQGETQ